jgi:hypothetical protein
MIYPPFLRKVADPEQCSQFFINIFTGLLLEISLVLLDFIDLQLVIHNKNPV